MDGKLLITAVCPPAVDKNDVDALIGIFEKTVVGICTKKKFSELRSPGPALWIRL